MSTHTRTSGLTDEQAAALTARDVSVALSAGAGCGKTFVLTERFLADFDPQHPDGLRPDQVGQLIAITFTDAAAREMRLRIRNRCYQRLLETNPADRQSLDYWVQMLRCLDSARISTIHSFCSSLIRAHAVEAGIDPRFGVFEQDEAETLLAEIIDETFRAQLAAMNADLLELLERYSLGDLQTMVASLVTDRQRDRFSDWLARTPEELAEHWQKTHARYAPRAVLTALAMSTPAVVLNRLAGMDVSPSATMIDRCATIRQKLALWLDDTAGRLNAEAELEELNEAARIVGVKQWASDEIKEAFGNAAQKVRDQITKARRQLAFDETAAQESAVASMKLLRVANVTYEEYTRRKRELGRLDFDDLLITACRLLTGPRNKKLRERQASQIQLLLVDEFQDTDPLQVELVKALCGEKVDQGKLFFVGDLKQSIYRFRGAKPSVFVDLQEAMPERGRLPLSRNFRSQPAILHFVNALFHDELTAEYRPLVPHRAQVSPQPAIEFCWPTVDCEEGERLSVGDLRQEEADWIARRLQCLFESGEPVVWDSRAAAAGTPAARPARYGDVAILFRALSDVQYYEQALQAYGIPYYLVGGNAFYAQQEIFDVVNLLRAVASSADALSLAGVLRSPFFSLADETLFWLAQDPEGLASGLLRPRLPEDLPAEEQRKVAFARETIVALRGMKDQVGVARLLEEALARTAYDALLVAEFLGERKLANLNKLLQMARTFDRSGLFTLDEFIERLSTFVADQPREPFAAMYPEAGNVVRLMSIHRSKGLEFPIVVVPDMDRGSGGHRARAGFTPELGPMISPPTRAAERDGSSGGLELHALLSSREEEEESRRLLYVATTRAADYLLLSAAVKNLDAPSSSWLNLLARHFDLKTGQLVAPLPAGWTEPQVRVTRVRPEPQKKPVDGKVRTSLSRLVTAARNAAARGKGVLPEHVGELPADPSAQRHFSFSRLTGILKSDEAEPEVVEGGAYVLPATVIDPLGLGTLVHAVLAELDFTADAGRVPPGTVARLVDRHIERHIEEPQGEADEAVELIERFLQSPLVAEMAAARQSHTELEFLLGWPPAGYTGDGCYLGGFIDRLWQDQAGDWHVLDFKTNRVTPRNVGSLAKKYELQMLVYGLAVEQIFSQAPRSLKLHFLRTGDEISFELNADARRRVTQMVDEAMAQVRRK